MRGEGDAKPRGEAWQGIIPACAGRRPRPLSCVARLGDHPRVCGEKFRREAEGEGEDGSSPRVRGEAVHSVGDDREEGIIPACAGRRHIREAFRSGAEDHPRVCGEKPRIPARLFCGTGSSPRVRGEDLFGWVDGFSTGIIPACAGRSKISRFLSWLRQDHPRVCGEKYLRFVDRFGNEGSSPRVRGEELRIS